MTTDVKIWLYPVVIQWSSWPNNGYPREDSRVPHMKEKIPTMQIKTTIETRPVSPSSDINACMVIAQKIFKAVTYFPATLIVYSALELKSA